MKKITVSLILFCFFGLFSQLSSAGEAGADVSLLDIMIQSVKQDSANLSKDGYKITNITSGWFKGKEHSYAYVAYYGGGHCVIQLSGDPIIAKQIPDSVRLGNGWLVSAKKSKPQPTKEIDLIMIIGPKNWPPKKVGGDAEAYFMPAEKQLNHHLGVIHGLIEKL